MLAFVYHLNLHGSNLVIQRLQTGISVIPLEIYWE